MSMPATRYAKSGNVHIAYQAFGSGRTDLVFVPGFISHIKNYWDHPDLARWLLRVPTLVIHCKADTLIPIECGRYMARHIPGARLIELPGQDHQGSGPSAPR